MTTPQPGWYDDPENPNGQRYWDGQNWTPHRQRKNATPIAPGTAHPTPTGPAVPGPWDQVRPIVNKARDDGQRIWSRQPRQQKIVLVVAGAAAVIVAAVVFVFVVGSLFGGGKSTSAFCGELESLWDGPSGVQNAVWSVHAARQVGTQPFVKKAELARAAENAEKLADDAPGDATAEGVELKKVFTEIARELSTAAAGDTASLQQLANDEAVTVWQATHCVRNG